MNPRWYRLLGVALLLCLVSLPLHGHTLEHPPELTGECPCATLCSHGFELTRVEQVQPSFVELIAPVLVQARAYSRARASDNLVRAPPAAT